MSANAAVCSDMCRILDHSCSPLFVVVSVMGAVPGPNYILKFSTSLAPLMVVGAVPGPNYILKFSTSLALLMVVGAVPGPNYILKFSTSLAPSNFWAR